MIRACRRWPACAAAACRPRPSAISSSASALPRPTAWWTRACSIFRARGLEHVPRRAAWRCCGPSKVVIENYPEGRIEELEAVNNPESPAAGAARSGSAGSFISSRMTLWRARRKVLPSGPGQGSAAALCLLCYLPRGREERRWRRGRAALQLRSSDPRRQHAARRSQGAGDPALGFGRRRRGGGGAPLQPIVFKSTPNAAAFATEINPNSLEVLGDCKLGSAAVADNAPGPSSSSELGYFCRDRSPSPATRCLTERLACATPGPRFEAGGR